jgi:Cof subfamily protein (haloacid dehalogenase superfamily)
MLAIDLDGTLLDSNRSLLPRNIEALSRARSSGIEVVLATGRLITSMRPFANQLGLAGPFICCNGAHVVDDGVELYHAGLSSHALRLAVEYSAAHRVHLNVYARTEVYFLFESPWGDLYRRRAGNIEPKLLTSELLATIEPTKLLFIGEPNDIQEHKSGLAKALEGLEYRFTESEPEYLEILSPNADKGSALRRLARDRGIDRTEVAAIGDYLNDLEMIRFAGVSAAIGNAVLQVKAVANSVVSSNDQAGVADFVDWIMLNRQE